MIKIDASTTAVLIHKYLALCYYQKFADDGITIECKRKFYKIQWKNIKHDLQLVFGKRQSYLPRIALVIMSIAYALMGKHEGGMWFGIGAVAADADTEGQNDGASTITVSHTTGSGSNRLMVFKSHVEANTNPSNRPVTGVTYNGVAGTVADTESFTSPGGEDDTCEIWYLIAPATGSNSAVVNWTGAVDGCVVNIETYTGVEQSSPIDASNSTSTTSTGPMQTTVTTSTNNCLLVGAVQTISSTRTITANSGQTQLYNLSNSGQLKGAGGYEIIGAAGNYTESWTINLNGDWLIVAVAFKEVATTTTVNKLPALGVG